MSKIEETAIDSFAIAAIMFVVGLIQFYFSPEYYYENTFLFTVPAATIFIVALLMKKRLLFILSIGLMLYCLYTILAYLLGDAIVGVLESLLGTYFGSYKTIASVYEIVLLPAIIFLTISAFRFSKNSNYETTLKRYITAIINSKEYKNTAIAIASIVLLFGIIAPFIDKIFITCSVASIASILFINNIKVNSIINSFIAFILYVMPPIALQLCYYVTEYSYSIQCSPHNYNECTTAQYAKFNYLRKHTALTFGDWPLRTHNIPLYVLFIPIAIMALLSFVQAISLLSQRNELTNNEKSVL